MEQLPQRVRANIGLQQRFSEEKGNIAMASRFIGAGQQSMHFVGWMDITCTTIPASPHGSLFDSKKGDRLRDLLFA